MGLLDLIFPKKCLECGRLGRYICEDCLRKVPPSGWAKGDLEVYSLWQYQGVIRKAIIALKYKFATDIARELANLCAERLTVISHWSSAILVPIPLHWYRQNFRGFNQSEEIGKAIVQKMGWKFLPDLLIRKKLTTPQVELKDLARRTNLKNVFSLNTKYQIQDTIYIIFDDVLTTGSTLREAAKVLKKSGAKKVYGLTVAR